MEALHQPGDIIAQRYRITDTLGQGGVGITYAAEDLKSGEQVALKVLSLRRMGDWKVLELFEREAKILAQLNHPGIPRYLDYFQVDTPEDRAFYIVQQLAEGKSLADLAKIGWRTNESGVRKIATQILEILIYLHSLKPPVIHRDIKPQNLIWGKDGKIFLVDFGAVQDTYRSTLAKSSTIVGTYGYMAPEQFRGQAVPATDLYGLGATVLFLLTHRSPSDLPQERLKISFRSRIQVSEGFANWLEKMLEPDVEDRFSSAKAALAALQGRMVVAKPRWFVSWKVLVGVAVAAVATGVVLTSLGDPLLKFLGLAQTSVHEAVIRGDIDTVRNYLKQGGDANATDSVFNTPLHFAVENNRKDIAELLISKGARVNGHTQLGTPLHIAVVKGNKDMVALLIANGADVNAKTNHGKTPLYIAVTSRNQDMAALLLANGADMNIVNKQGETLLHIAVANCDQEMTAWLLANGADINAKTTKTAQMNQRSIPLELGSTPLHIALANCNQGIAGLLIAKGAQVNAKDNQDRTPLHLADANTSADVVELLIAKGAQVNAKDNQDRTPLHSAAANASADVVELLIAKGAQVNAKDNRGGTPLHWAAENASADVIELLICFYLAQQLAEGRSLSALVEKGWHPNEPEVRHIGTQVLEILIYLQQLTPPCNPPGY